MKKIHLAKLKRWITFSFIAFFIFVAWIIWGSIDSRLDLSTHAAMISGGLRGGLGCYLLYIGWIYARRIEFNIKELQEKIDSFYEQALEEVNCNELDKSIWARAYSLCEGDKIKAEAKYIQLRTVNLEESHFKKIKERNKKPKTKNRGIEENKKRKMQAVDYFVGGVILIGIILWLFQSLKLVVAQ
ncbi:MAG: hypothetical protein H6971_10385 [Gammaproteobacteria bacterium]|nr:hypothetical protein [Gammaproteobacteria bacterium]